MAAKLFPTDKIRNVAVVGHSSTGKTSLISALLFDSKELNRLGKVDKGSAITDFDEEAVERKITIGVAAAHATHRECKLNLIDTPGYAIFTTEAIQGLKVSEAGLMMVSAVAGPEVQTDKLWKTCAEMRKPVLFAVNLMDRERASASRTIQQLQKRFGREVIAVQLPIGEEHSFSGVVDLLRMKALTFAADESGAIEEKPVPDDLVAEAEAARAALVEMVAEQDEALLEKFFADGALPEAELTSGLRAAVAARAVFPVYFCSAAHNRGVRPIMDALVDLVPDPGGAPAAARTIAGDEVRLQANPDATPVAYVFKTISDPFAGRITLLRVFSGSLVSDSSYTNRQRDVVERFGPVAWVQGKELAPVEKLVAGDIGGVAKLKETHTGETLTSKDGTVVVPAVPIPDAAISFAITPKAKGDEDKIAQGLAKLQEEDPTLRLGRDPQTKEQLVAGAGQLHVEIAVSRLRRRYKVDVTLQPPKVPYRETITRAIEITTRHKKQTGGHASSPRPRSASSRCPAAAATSSSTRSSGARSRRTTAPRSTRGSRPPGRPGRCPATRWSTSA
jgi:elongation factor G